jgi:hypothetical protein
VSPFVPLLNGLGRFANYTHFSDRGQLFTTIILRCLCVRKHLRSSIPSSRTSPIFASRAAAKESKSERKRGTRTSLTGVPKSASGRRSSIRLQVAACRSSPTPIIITRGTVLRRRGSLRRSGKRNGPRKRRPRARRICGCIELTRGARRGLHLAGAYYVVASIAGRAYDAQAGDPNQKFRVRSPLPGG